MVTINKYDAQLRTLYNYPCPSWQHGCRGKSFTCWGMKTGFWIELSWKEYHHLPCDSIILVKTPSQLPMALLYRYIWFFFPSVSSEHSAISIIGDHFSVSKLFFTLKLSDHSLKRAVRFQNQGKEWFHRWESKCDNKWPRTRVLYFCPPAVWSACSSV